MDYQYLYEKYKSRYLNRQFGGTSTNNPSAIFTISGELNPCLAVVDLTDLQLKPAHEMFQLLHGVDASVEGCNPSLPNPEVVSRRFGCFGKRTVTAERGKTQINTCNFTEGEIKTATALINNSVTLLQSYLDRDVSITGGVNVNGEKPLIEAHRYTSHHECPLPKRPFAWHQDDFGAIDFPTYTIIYYLYKDDRFQGGNFNCAFPGDEIEIKAGELSGIQRSDKTIQEDGVTQQVYNIETRTGRVVILRGNLWHIPGEFLDTCHGCRDSVVVQIARK